MGKRVIEAEVLNFMLDQYLNTAKLYVNSPGDSELRRQLRKDFASLNKLHLRGAADWLQIWDDFTNLHRMSLRMQQSESSAHVRKLDILKKDFILHYMARMNMAYLDDASVPYTVPMSTGKRISLESVPMPSPGMAYSATFEPGSESSVSDEGAFARHNDRVAPVSSFEKRHLTARAPSVVVPDAKFSIIACIDVVSPGEGLSAQLAEVAIPASGLMVTVESIVGGKLKLLGPASQQACVLPGEKSPEIEISLQATELGSAEVVLRARTDQAYLGDLRISMMIANHGAPDLQDVKSGIAAAPLVARKATLTVTYSRADLTYRFMLFGDATGIHSAELRLDEKLDEMVPRLMAQANNLARGTIGYSAGEVERMLSGIGAELWNRLLPDKIKVVLIACWNGIDRLDIVSDDDMIPWELLFAYVNDGPDMGFISDKWLVSRWRFGAGAPGDVGAGPSVYVIPANAPQAANDEIDELRKIFPSQAVWKTVGELNNGMRRPGMGLLHIAAHNNVLYGNAAASFISLDKPFPQSMLGPQLQGVLEHRPLVFINACASAAPTVQWQGATSWASRFLNAGAGAFIGSNWEVRDDTASSFALEFYGQARQQPLGLAFQRARAKSGGPGDPTRFAYSFFGHPDAVLQTQGAAAP
ncbi:MULTISPECIES: CHAT domain-containing protein [unclassified Pseudomonas]|uniref:CHAT domain-containing protein n=1 Tax=unclassified Pseudomonas TaxID=196821 RepID=UPI00244A21D3|nr:MULTISPECIES: CHAT domain-containing protein [unclassified Pseudomonas]MDG9927381.1 CHAT domain-containing protein [Pseudomonas sp. GD04042]MDH0482450.1 CHAT domain-containing protein [Pseudomonas sp. GD04015]MDH0602802.1 CHAT domain-containing protein [Pseudomonas sp. GD03869]